MPTSNLANVYAFLLRKYGNNYTITYSQPPSYVKKIIGCDDASEKVVFFYLEDRSKLKAATASYISPSKLHLRKNDGEAGQLDLTGSPLKDECIVEAIDDDIALDLKRLVQNPWRIEEECHKGVSIEKGRAVVSSTAFQKGGDDIDSQTPYGSVWFLCNAEDNEKTLLLQHEFTRSGQYSRGVVNFMGCVPPSAVNAHNLLERHYTLIRPGSPVETTIENTYQIKSNIALDCTWTTSTATMLPSLIDLTSCDVTLRQHFDLGDCGPLTEDFMNQLRILAFIRDDIMAYKEAERRDSAKEAIYRCGTGISLEELHEGINKVMTEIAGFAEIADGSGNEECNIEAVVHRAKLRQLTDLTDKLWEILKCCSSYKDLKAAFNILFQCAARCNVVNTPTNKNRLAEMITEVANRRLAIPCLSGSEPLELLLEIGLEKLHKDYEFIFTESKICSSNLLKSESSSQESEQENDGSRPNVRKSIRNAVRSEAQIARKTLLHNNMKSVGNKYQNDDDIAGFKNSNFDEHDSAARLAKLLQIHCALEHLLLIQINLNLNNVYSEVCQQLLKKPARWTGSIADTLKDEMEISLSSHDIRDLLEGREPHTRHITMKSRNKFRDVQSSFFYSMENICPPGISEGFGVEDKEIVKENIYYCWTYRKIKTLRN